MADRRVAPERRRGCIGDSEWYRWGLVSRKDHRSETLSGRFGAQGSNLRIAIVGRCHRDEVRFVLPWCSGRPRRSFWIPSKPTLSPAGPIRPSRKSVDHFQEGIGSERSIRTGSGRCSLWRVRGLPFDLPWLRCGWAGRSHPQWVGR